MTTSENASGLPIGQLGSTIKAHMGAAEKYIGKCEEHYRSAGQHLIEAKRRILENKEFAGDFKGFLMNCCNGLAERRAYELIEVANGTHSVASIREDDAERHRKLYAERKAAAATAAETPQSADPQSNQPLGATNSGNLPEKSKGGRPASPKTPEAMRWARIVKANKSKPFTVDQLDILLTLIATF